MTLHATQAPGGWADLIALARFPCRLLALAQAQFTASAYPNLRFDPSTEAWRAVTHGGTHHTFYVVEAHSTGADLQP